MPLLRLLLATVCLLVTPLQAQGPDDAPPAVIRVAAASSLSDALEDIARDFEQTHAIQVELVLSSSGKLLAQLRAGAPIDVLIFAAARQMEEASAAGLIDPATRQDIAGNTLVVVVPASRGHATGEPIARDPATVLSSDAVRRVAVGEPTTVPAGQYADQALRHLKLDERLSGKRVYGATARQVLDYVVRGEVDAGIVYATDAASADDAVSVAAVISPDTHDPIVYPAAVVSGQRQPAAATAFVAYLRSPAAQQALRARGFTAVLADSPATSQPAGDAAHVSQPAAPPPNLVPPSVVPTDLKPPALIPPESIPADLPPTPQAQPTAPWPQ